MNYDLSRIEKRFREKFASLICELNDESELEITEKLFKREKRLRVPFGFIKLHLVIENGRPMLHVRLISRMDANILYLIDDEKIMHYDMDDREAREKLKKRRAETVFGCEICNELKDGYFPCPKCGRGVFDFNYMNNLKRMEKKYGTRALLKLSEEKLTFKEIITIRSFVERCDHHCGDNSTTDRCRSDGTFTNLDKRVNEIKKENQLS